MSDICGRKKMGEYNMLQCYRNNGHNGECVYGLENKDATIARLEAEIADLRAEVEQLKKELRILYSSNADMFARAEQAEKELAAERGKSKCNHEWKEWTSTAGRTRQCIKCGQQYSWFG